MSSDSSPSGSGDRSPPGDPAQEEPTAIDKDIADKNGEDPQNDGSCSQNGVVVQSRSGRPTRACTVRAAARYQQQLAQVERKPKATPKKEQRVEEPPSPPQQCGSSRVVTPLVEPPPDSLLPRWNLRCMWELASVLNFLHIFRPLLNISIEFSAEEFETALLTPNDTLAAIHMPLMKAIPPVTRMALTRDTWITVLCRKLRDWWHWVAEGELPIVASHGTEIEVYKSLDPSIRVVILKALCDIRVEQEDIRNYIENSLKHGAHLSAFRKERVGGDSYGVHYWYEDDPIIGHRLYRETRKVEVKRAKARGSQVIPIATYNWETVATNFDEFQDVSEKLFSSSNRTEVSLGKKLKIDMLPDIEREHRKKEKLLKKQQREALLLDNFISMDGLGPGRSLRDRKPVTYTFDDYDRSINEAIKITKRKQSSPEAIPRREGLVKQEVSANGNWSEGQGQHASSGFADFSAVSPNSPYSDGADEEEDHDNPDQIDRRQRKRPQRYSDKDFVEAVSDMEADLDDSDDDIVGEAVYDEEYLRKRKQRKLSSSSEGDEEYHMDDENAEEEYQVDEEDEEEEEDSFGVSEDSDDDRPKFKKLRGRTRRETKLRSVKEIQSGLRRSKRATRNRINYRRYEYSDSEAETTKKPEKWNKKPPPSNEHYSGEEEGEEEEGEEEASEGPREVYSDGSGDNNNSENNEDDDDEEEHELKTEGQPVQSYHEPTAEKDEFEHVAKKLKGPSQEDDPLEGAEEGGSSKWGFLDLNELAPGSSGFDDGPPLPPNNTTVVKDAEDRDDL